VVTSNTKEGRGVYSSGTVIINDGTVHVEAAGNAYAIKRDGGTFTVNGGKFNINGSSSYINYGSAVDANVAIKGGYYTTNNRLANVVPSPYVVYDWASEDEPYKYTVAAKVAYAVTFQNTDGTTLQAGTWAEGMMPAYAGDAPTKPGDTEGEWMLGGWTPDLASVTEDATYMAVYVPAPPVASVTISGTTTNYYRFANAWSAVNGASAASTLTLLQDVALTSMLTFTSSRNCTFDLNGYTISNTNLVMFNLNKTGITFTLTDGSEEQTGKVVVNSTGSSTAYGVLVSKGAFVLHTGTIEAHLQANTSQGVRVASGASFTMEGGMIDVVTTNAKNGDGVFANTTGTATITGGTIRVNAAGVSYAVEAVGTVTVSGGHFYAAGSSAACVTGSLTLQGGYYNLNTNLSDNTSVPYYVFPNADETYLYKVAEGYTLTWSTDGELAGEGYTPSGLTPVGTPVVAPTSTKSGYVFAGWTPSVAETMPAANTTYTAQWAVASVTIGETTTLYTTFAAAWTAANSSTAASTIQLLSDVTVTEQLTYNNSNTQNCTLDLNGYTLTSTTNARYPLHINRTGVTFTITDSGESGTLLLNTTSTSTIFGVFAEIGNIRLNGGTIEVRSGSATTCGVTANSTGTFTMNAGTIHVVTTNAKEGRGIYSGGTVTVHDGIVLVEAAGVAYAMKRDGGTMTVNGGKFNVTSSGATAYITNQASANANVVITGGKYNTDAQLVTCVSAPYHVFDLEGESPYLYKVAEGYTVTFYNYDDTSLQSSVWEKGAIPAYSGTPTKPADAQYTYTFNGWSPAISSVTANATYTAQYSSTINNYTVTVVKNVDDYGSISGTEIASVPYGSTITVEGNTFTVNGTTVTATPETSDAQYTYTFDGWTNAPGTVTGDVTITANFTRTINTYTVLWKNADGTTLETDENVPYGTTPTYDGATPTKATDEEYAYTFDSWSPAVSAINGNTEYTATYSMTPVVASVTISDATTYYTTFDAAWSAVNTASAASTLTLLQNVTNASYVTYQNNKNKDCTLDLNGHMLSSSSGLAIIVMSKSSTTFTIDDSSEGETGRLYIERTDNSNTYGVYINSGALQLEAGTIEVHAQATTSGHGGVYTATAGSTSFTMNGGHIVVENTVSEAHGLYNKGTMTINGGTIRAHSTNNKGYGVRWVDGTVTVNNGKFHVTGKTDADASIAKSTSATITTPVLELQGGYYNDDIKESLATYCASNYHVFPASLTESGLTYSCKVAEGYTVTFNNYDDTELQSGVWEKGTTPVYSGATPTKPADAQYTYAFDTWSPAISSVAADATYTAQYSSTVNNYTVTIAKNEDSYGSISATEITSVPYGSTITVDGNTFTVNGTTVTATPETSDAQYTYTFDGWTNAPGTVNGNVTITANFTRTVNNYTVTIAKNEDSYGSISATEITSVPYGSTITVDGNTFTVNGTMVTATPETSDAQYTYAFSGWTNAPGTVNGNVTITANFTRTTNTYTVLWKDEDGTILETDENVPYGSTPSFDGTTPTKPADEEYVYTFAGWTPDLSSVTGDVTYTATYNTTPVVASVTISDITTYYTTFDAAWSTANGAAAASTITLLDDITGLSSSSTYSAAHNLTLDLNGHTLSGSSIDASLFQVACAGHTFTVTDGSANHNGSISFTATGSSNSYCVIVNSGTFVLNAGMLEASFSSSSGNIAAVQVNSGGTFTMNENGTLHAKYTGSGSGKNSRAVHANGGATTVNGGTIHLESTKDGIGVVYSSGNVTVNGGRFKIIASGTAAVTNKDTKQTNLNIRGGYYSENATQYFTPHVKAPYYIFSNADAEFPQKVAEGYTVTFNVNGHGTAPESQLIEKNAHATTPETLSETGYTFGGWYKEQTCTNAWDFASDEVTQTTTLYAQWTPNTNTPYVVKHYQQNINNDEYTLFETENKTGTTDASVTPAVKSYTGFTAPDAQMVTILADGSLEVTYQYARNSYNLTWNANGGELSGEYTSGLVKFGATITAPMVARTNYDFDGWDEEPANTMPAEDKTYTAQWTAINYTISYDLAGGSVASANPTGYTVESSAFTLNNPTKANYVFAGWTGTDLASATISVTIPAGSTGNRSYTATWTPAVASVTVSGVTTYYTTFDAAWSAVNTAAEASTIKLLHDVTVTSILTYNNSNTQNCTLDLYGHTITSTQAALLNPTKAGITFTLTDSSDGQNGRMLSNATNTSTAYGVLISAGTFVLEAGTIEAHLKANTSYGIRVAAGATFTMEGGMIDVVTTSGKPASGVYTHYNAGNIGTATINGGSIRVNAAAVGYAVENKGTTTITGGKFYATGTSAACIYRNGGTVVLQGGYYNSATNLSTYTSSPYVVRETTAEDKATIGSDYTHKIIEYIETGFYVDIVDVDNEAKTLTLNVTGWASSGWPYTVNEVAYEKTARQADRTLIIPYTGNAGDAFSITIMNKSGETVSKHNYIIPTAIITNATLGDQQMLYVKAGATLTVNTSKTVKNIYVAPGAKLVVNSDITLTADTVFLRTMPWESAELELAGTIEGQVCYTRIIKKKDQYYQFGLPRSCDISAVRLSDGSTPTYGNGWLLRSYSESSRAHNGTGTNIDNWETLNKNAEDEHKTIIGGVGYEMFSNSGYYREYYFPIDHTVNVETVDVTRTTDDTKGASQEGWNIVVSPLLHAYTSYPRPEGMTFCWLQEDGSYWQQPVEEVKPAIPFTYQAAQTGRISFEDTSVEIVAAAPRRRVSASEEPVRIQWMHLDIQDENGIGDQTSIYSHPSRYEVSYKTGIDVAKQSLTASRAILYSTHAYGDMAFAGVADSLLEKGIALTVYSPKAQELTITMRENQWLNRMAYVWLVDHETGARTDLLTSAYTFDAASGTTSGRFTIEGVFYAPQIATDLENGELMNDEMVKARKVMIDQKMYIIVNGRMYDANGKMVRSE